MERAVELPDLRVELEALAYPATREDVLAEFGDMVVLYADGEDRFEDALGRMTEDVFVGPEDLEAAVYDALPAEPVTESGRSERDG